MCTSCSLHKSSWSSCTRARVCKQVSQCVLHTHHETGSYNVTVQESAPVLHTQLSHQHTDRRLTKVNTKVPKIGRWRACNASMPHMAGLRASPRASGTPTASPPTGGTARHSWRHRPPARLGAATAASPLRLLDAKVDHGPPAPPVTAAAGSVRRSFTVRACCCLAFSQRLPAARSAARSYERGSREGVISHSMPHRLSPEKKICQRNSGLADAMHEAFWRSWPAFMLNWGPKVPQLSTGFFFWQKAWPVTMSNPT